VSSRIDAAVRCASASRSWSDSSPIARPTRRNRRHTPQIPLPGVLEPASATTIRKTPESHTSAARREAERTATASAQQPIGAATVGARAATAQAAARGASGSSDGTAPPTPPRHPPRGGSPPPSRPRRPGFEIDWEQWIGVRGAAVLAAPVALAGLYFFNSIEHGLIPPGCASSPASRSGWPASWRRVKARKCYAHCKRADRRRRSHSLRRDLHNAAL
jgi:hypothetical protein